MFGYEFRRRIDSIERRNFIEIIIIKAIDRLAKFVVDGVKVTDEPVRIKLLGANRHCHVPVVAMKRLGRASNRDGMGSAER